MGFISGIRARQVRLIAAKKARVREMGQSPDPVREHTREGIQSRIDTQTRANIRYFADKGPEELTRRIGELDREWTLDRALMAAASVAVLAGLAFHRFGGRRWLLAPAAAAFLLLEHVFEGWFLTAALFRGLGFRTDREVQFEKYALKLLRGDFTVVSEGNENYDRDKLTAELLGSEI